MKGLQLDMFHERAISPLEREMNYVKEVVSLTKDSTEKVRRSLYARNNELEKKCLDLNERLAIIERYICKH